MNGGIFWDELFDLDPGGRNLGRPRPQWEVGILERSDPSADEETPDVECDGVRGGRVGASWGHRGVEGGFAGRTVVGGRHGEEGGASRAAGPGSPPRG